MNEAEKLKTTMSSVFRRKGGDGRFTRLFDNLEPCQKEALLQEVQLSEGELPVIGSAESRDKWLLVTTKRIVWHLGNKIQTLPIEVVRDVIADFQKLIATGRKKNQMRELQILTMEGQQHTVEVEEGAPHLGVWNALKNLGARNRQ